MAAHYEDDEIKIHKLKCGPYDNNAYLLVSRESNESIIIDTPADPGELIRAASGTDVKAILITHNHSDHIQGCHLGHWKSRRYRRSGRRRSTQASGPPSQRRRRDHRRHDSPQGAVDTRTHAWLDLLCRWQAPVLRRYAVPGWPRAVRVAGEAGSAHRQHHQDALRAGRRPRSISRARRRRRHRDIQTGVRRLRIQEPRRGPVRRCKLVEGLALASLRGIWQTCSP